MEVDRRRDGIFYGIPLKHVIPASEPGSRQESERAARREKAV